MRSSSPAASKACATGVADLVHLRLRFRGRPQVLLEALQRSGARVGGIVRRGEHLELRIPFAAVRDLRSQIRGEGRLEVLGHGGWGLVLRAVRRRPWRLAVPIFALILYLMASSRVWQVQVVGAGDLPRTEILRVAAAAGLRPGGARAPLSPYRLGSRIAQEVPNLLFAAVRLDGVRAYIYAARDLKTPVATPQEVRGTITSAEYGYVTRVVVLRGQATVRAGDTVMPGEPLILPRDGYASGQVFARVWRSYTTRAPLSTRRAYPTGRHADRWYIVLGGGRQWTPQGRTPPFRNARVQEKRWRIPFTTVELARFRYVELREAVMRRTPQYLEVQATQSALDALGKAEPGAKPLAVRADTEKSGQNLTVRVQVEAEVNVAHSATGGNAAD